MDRALNHTAIEKSALERFSDVIGGLECRQILRDWFPRLRERVTERNGYDADAFDYERELEDATDLLEGIRQAFSFYEPRASGQKGSLWAWPTEDVLNFPPKEWTSRTNPVNVAYLEDYITSYIAHPWLQHNVIDSTAINAFLFSELPGFKEAYDTGEFVGRPKWSYVLSGGNFYKMLWLAPALGIGRFLAIWVVLPLVSIALAWMEYFRSAVFIFGVWIVYLAYRVIRFPARRRVRHSIREREEQLTQTWAAMKRAWRSSSGSVINPMRLKELISMAEDRGATYRPTLHTLIDRAIERDATALITGRRPLPQPATRAYE